MRRKKWEHAGKAPVGAEKTRDEDGWRTFSDFNVVGIVFLFVSESVYTVLGWGFRCAQGVAGFCNLSAGRTEEYQQEELGRERKSLDHFKFEYAVVCRVAMNFGEYTANLERMVADDERCEKFAEPTPALCYHIQYLKNGEQATKNQR
jgi:hypothetical protein